MNKFSLNFLPYPWSWTFLYQFMNLDSGWLDNENFFQIFTKKFGIHSTIPVTRKSRTCSLWFIASKYFNGSPDVFSCDFEGFWAKFGRFRPNFWVVSHIQILFFFPISLHSFGSNFWPKFDSIKVDSKVSQKHIMFGQRKKNEKEVYTNFKDHPWSRLSCFFFSLRCSMHWVKNYLF